MILEGNRIFVGSRKQVLPEDRNCIKRKMEFAVKKVQKSQ